MAADDSPGASVQEAIGEAELLLPGVPADEDEPDPRWHAIIHVAEFLETDPEEVWAFACRWGTHEQEDLRGAIATCILEHLLDFDFEAPLTHLVWITSAFGYMCWSRCC